MPSKEKEPTSKTMWLIGILVSLLLMTISGLGGAMIAEGNDTYGNDRTFIINSLKTQNTEVIELKKEVNQLSLQVARLEVEVQRWRSSYPPPAP